MSAEQGLFTNVGIETRKRLAIAGSILAGVGFIGAVVQFSPLARAAGFAGAEAAKHKPNDPDYASDSLSLQAMRSINAEEGFAVIQELQKTSHPQAEIAYLDTGINTSNTDIKVNWTYNALNADIRDNFDHGTSVISIGSATMDNGQGIAGIDGGINKVDVVKVNGTSAETDHTKNPDFTIANGITTAHDHGARIFNLSFGYTNKAGCPSVANTINAMRQDSDSLFVIAKGNNGAEDTLASCASGLPNTLLVSGANADGSFDTTTNAGGDLRAPSFLMAETNSGSHTVRGASFAAPVVSATAGVALDCKPSMNGAEMKNLILANAPDQTGPAPTKLVNPYRTWLAAGCPKPADVVTTTTNTTTTTEKKKYPLSVKITTGGKLGHLLLNGKRKPDSFVYQTTVKGQKVTIKAVKDNPKAYVKSVTGCENDPKKDPPKSIACVVKLDGVHAGKPAAVENVHYVLASH
jgi:hypothetical protein